jgi:hypothetical protein
MGLANLGPEIVLTFAAGQWSRARHSVQAFHDAGYAKWIIRMAFFADMGSFVLQAADADCFPINAKQLYWLVVHKFVKFPNIAPEKMWDKSEQNRLAKLITSIQAAYVIVQCIGHAIQDLAIKTLELNTLVIVVCSLMAAFAWLHKPSDVRHPIRLETTSPICNITGQKPWKNTPLDFVDENGPGWSMNVQPFMKMPVIPPMRPIQRIPDDRFPMDPYNAQEYCLCFVTAFFTSVHVGG